MINGKKIVVVIPALNEEMKIGDTIDAVPDFVDHIIVVNDGSTDNTASIAEEKNATVISHYFNKGVGAAFNTGVKAAIDTEADIMVNMDADGQFNPADIKLLIQPICSGQADFVTASRFISKEFYPNMSKIKFWGNRFMSWFISTLTKHKFYDVSCGFRAYSRDTLFRLNLFGHYTYTQETFIDLAFKRLTIEEIPIRVRGKREHGKSRVASNLFKYAFQTFKIIIRTYRDYSPFRLFGFIGLITFLLGSFFAIFLTIHYLQTGIFTPHKWAGFTAGFLGVFSLLFMILGFVLDMFARMRKNQEDILYILKRKLYNEK